MSDYNHNGFLLNTDGLVNLTATPIQTSGNGSGDPIDTSNLYLKNQYENIQANSILGLSTLKIKNSNQDNIIITPSKVSLFSTDGKINFIPPNQSTDDQKVLTYNSTTQDIIYKSIDLSNYYTKTETYTRTELDDKLRSEIKRDKK